MVFDDQGLSAEDLGLLERLAKRVVELHMEVPAILALEGARPLSMVASQAMIFFEPLAQGLLGVGDYRRYAKLIERRENLELLERLIESRAEAARAKRSTKSPPRQPPSR